MHKLCLFFPSVLFTFFLICCSSSSKAPSLDLELKDQFPQVQKQDTFHFGVEAVVDRSIPEGLLLKAIDTAMLANLMYEYPDSAAIYDAGSRFALDDRHEACILQIRQFWFTFVGMLIFDQKTESFVRTVPLASFFGGEGGQVWEESWLYWTEQEKYPALLTHRSEHSLYITEDGEPVDRYQDSFLLQHWDGRHFVGKKPAQDSAVLSKQFPINWW